MHIEPWASHNGAAHWWQEQSLGEAVRPSEKVVGACSNSSCCYMGHCAGHGTPAPVERRACVPARQKQVSIRRPADAPVNQLIPNCPAGHGWTVHFLNSANLTLPCRSRDHILTRTHAATEAASQLKPIMPVQVAVPSIG